MNKKILLTLICVVVLLCTLSACSKTIKQDAVPGAELDKPVENNGGLVVKQGKHIYFVNGYDANVVNDFGTPYKSAIMRAELDADGKLVADSQKVIVPLNAYSSSTSYGIYIYNGWIYYATPNAELDNSGEVNTVYLDFNRTKVDASETETLFTIKNRSADFRFTDGWLNYVNEAELHAVNLNAKKVNNEKNDVSLMDRVGSSKMIVSDTAFGDYTLVVRNLDEATSYKTFNELWAVSADGSVKTCLIGGTTYATVDTDVNNTYKISIQTYNIVGNDLTVFYTKSKTIGGTATVTGLFSYTFTGGAFAAVDSAKEKQLTYNTATAVTAVGDANNTALITDSSRVIKAQADSVNKPVEFTNEQKVVIGKGVTVKFVRDSYVYYTASSSATALFRFKLDGTGVEEKVCDMTEYTSWAKGEIIGNYYYYLDSTTYYLHRIDLVSDGVEAELVGKMTADDAKTYADDEE
jgi:hypothetical protein